MTDPAGSAPRKWEWTRVPLATRQMLLKVQALRPFGLAESDSLMQFAAHGSLPCTCLGRNCQETAADRREVCRLCGGLHQLVNAAVRDRPGSREEIRAQVELLRMAGVRARGLAIPDSVRTVHELHAYLDRYEGNRGRKPPRRPNAPVALVRQSGIQDAARIA